MSFDNVNNVDLWKEDLDKTHDDTDNSEKV